MPQKNHFWLHKEPTVKGSLKNHLFLTFLKIWRTFFHHKEQMLKVLYGTIYSKKLFQGIVKNLYF